jgi:hypothetical protein
MSKIGAVPLNASPPACVMMYAIGKHSYKSRSCN